MHFKTVNTCLNDKIFHCIQLCSAIKGNFPKLVCFNDFVVIILYPHSHRHTFPSMLLGLTLMLLEATLAYTK